MIWESAYWKEELFRQAAHLERRRTQTRWPERSFATLEKTVMIGFYSIRKLLEAKKISDSIRELQLPIMKYLPTGKRVTLMNWHRAEKLYRLNEEPQISAIALYPLSNIFIHSYTFLPVHNETGGLEGILVNSERTRGDGLFHVDVADIIGVFLRVAADDPFESRMVFDEAKGDYKVALR